MSQMRKPEMEVIRFTESDIVVASNGSRRMQTASLNLTGFGQQGVKGDGIATLNGTSYSINTLNDVDTFTNALNNSDIFNAGISNGTTTQTLRGTFRAEVNKGAEHWDGYYLYDSDAIWNNGNKNLKGVFIRQ